MNQTRQFIKGFIRRRSHKSLSVMQNTEKSWILLDQIISF